MPLIFHKNRFPNIKNDYWFGFSPSGRRDPSAGTVDGNRSERKDDGGGSGARQANGLTDKGNLDSEDWVGGGFLEEFILTGLG